MSVVFLFPTSPAPGVNGMNYTVVVLFGTLFLSLVWYYFPVYGGVHWFTGPVATVARKGDADSEDASVSGDTVEETGEKGSKGRIRIGVQDVPV